MAVSTDQLLLKLNPMNVSGIQQGLESLQQSSIERQRLAQAREQLEETRRRHQEDERLRKIAEQNQMQRHTEGLAFDQQRLAREREAEKIARQDALGKEFAGRLAGGDVAGANVFAALAPSVGMAINVEGMTDGMPRYRIDHDPAATAAREAEEAEMIAELPDETATESLGRMNVLGLDTADERGTLDPPIGMGGQEAFGAAQEASRFFEDTGVPMAGPDEEDLLGGIPRDVVDMGALRDMTMRKLRPGMQSLVEAYPEVYQDSADKTAQGVMELNLPPKETAELFDQLRGGGPDALIGQGIAADAARTKRGEMTFKDEFDILEGGRNRGDKLAQSYAVRDIVERRQPLSSALQVLNNETDEDDYLVGAPVARIVFGEKGATTDPDVQRVLGDEASSFFDSLKKQAYKQAFGGLSPEKKQALREVLKAKQLYDARQVMEYIDSVYDAAAKYEGHPYGEGLKESLANVPREYLQLYERMVADREKRGLSKRQALDEHVGVPDPDLIRGQVEQERRQRGSAAPGRPAGRGGAAGPTGSFKMPEKDDPDGFYTEFSRQAQEAGYDPEKLLPLVRTETAGKMSADATNPRSGATGLIQFLNEGIAKSVGTTMAELKKMSRVEQIPYVIEYLKTRGVTPEHSQGDIYVAIAGPAALKENDNYPVYSKRRKSTRKEYQDNAEQWDLDGDGTITRGELYRYGEGARRQGPDKPMGDAGKVLYSKGSRAYNLNSNRDANEDGHVTRAELDASEAERKRGRASTPAPKTAADRKIEAIMRKRRKAE